MTIRITVASIEQKPKRSVIVTPEGRRYGCFSEKMATFGFELGGAYDIETTTHESGGMTLTNITKAKRIAAETPSPSTASTNGNGHHTTASNSYRPTAPEDAERMWVCAVLTALIKAGKVGADKAELWKTTKILRNLYNYEFGNPNLVNHTEAAE
jgi:hypothetical protein